MHFRHLSFCWQTPVGYLQCRRSRLAVACGFALSEPEACLESRVRVKLRRLPDSFGHVSPTQRAEVSPSLELALPFPSSELTLNAPSGLSSTQMTQ